MRQERNNTHKLIPYPNDLADIVQGAVNKGDTPQAIYVAFSQDKTLKSILEIDNEQIKSAIKDAFLIFRREFVEL